MAKALLIDLDGTIYKGNRSIEGAKAFIECLEENHIPYLFMTNNATRSHTEAQRFLKDTHDISVPASRFFTSVDAMAFILENKPQENNKDKTAYVIGSSFVKETLQKMGYQLEDTDYRKVSHVIVSLDRELNYADLAFACLAIQEGAQFILTNPDIQFPTVEGFTPGAGALGQLVAQVTRVEPIVCGKPEVSIVEGALEKMGVAKSDVVLLGDNLLTDIQAGVNAEIQTVHIETGVHKRSDSKTLGIHPTQVVTDYAELMEQIDQLIEGISCVQK